jgi:hypothetical protein
VTDHIDERKTNLVSGIRWTILEREDRAPLLIEREEVEQFISNDTQLA